ASRQAKPASTTYSPTSSAPLGTVPSSNPFSPFSPLTLVPHTVPHLRKASMVPTQNPLPPVPTTKILAISHFMGTPMTPAQRTQIMPHEVHDTVNAYLAGKIDQWYFRTDGKGVVFIVNASTPEEAKNILEKFPLGQAGLMGFDYIPLGPLSPLRIINDMVK